MYSDFFGLRSDPFPLHADPRAFYASSVHGRAKRTLIHCLRHQSGLLLVLGNVGSGKTTLCAHVQHLIRQEFQVANINNPLLTSRQWLQDINNAFGFSTFSKNPLLELKKNLAASTNQGKKAVLFIDEGHLLTKELLEHLLILCNLEEQNRPCLSIVLSALPELEEKISEPSLTALSQRVRRKIYLYGLSFPDTLSYIEHRLALAESKSSTILEPQAVRYIWKKSSGTPRLINHICSKSLESAALKQKARINKHIVRKALQDYDIVDLFPAKNIHLKKSLPIIALSFLMLSSFMATDLQNNSSLPKNVRQEISLTKNTKIKDPKNPTRKEEKLLSVLESLQQEISLWRKENHSPKGSIYPVTQKKKKQFVNKVKEVQKKNKTETAIRKKDEANDNISENKARQAKDFSIPEDLGNNLKVQAIVWSPTPQARIVVINDRIFAQGENIQGVRIVKIQKENVVLEKSGITFYKKITRKQS